MRLSPPLFTLFGALLMLATQPVADGQDKKDDGPKAPFLTYVKFERVTDGKVTNTVEKIPAYAIGKDLHWVLGSIPGGVAPAKGDRLTDEGGKTYTVVKSVLSVGLSQYTTRTTPAPDEKYRFKKGG